MSLRVRLRELPLLRQLRSSVLGARGTGSAYLWGVRQARLRGRLSSDARGVRPVVAGRFRLCGRTVGGYSAAQAAADDLALVTGVLEAGGIPYFLVPGHSGLRHVVGVEESFREKFFELAGRGFRNTCAYVGAVDQAGEVASAVLWAGRRLPVSVRRATVLRTGVVRLAPAGRSLGDLETGCEVEFWNRGEDLPPVCESGDTWLTVPGRQLGEAFTGALVAPRGNRVSEVVPPDAQTPAKVTVRHREVPTFEPFAEPGIDDVRFPVDAVYTWVDGSDPAMAARRQAYRDRTRPQIAGREIGPSRYTSHDELRYSLRSLQMYAQFIRHVYIVTDGQVPAWLDPDAEGITVVDHREIFPATALPVFNSHAIETRLHHIPGLSERYLYFNDDVFINRPVRAETFFHGNGIARIPLSPLKIGVGAPSPLEPAPNSAAKNVRRLIRQTYGRSIANKSLHTPHPQLVSVLQEIESAGFEEVERTTRSRFRSASDVSTATTLHHHWAMLSGRAVPAEYRFRYVDVGKPEMAQRLARIEKGEDIDFFCLNDVDTEESAREAVQAAIGSFLERRFPFPSRAERQALLPQPRFAADRADGGADTREHDGPGRAGMCR